MGEPGNEATWNGEVIKQTNAEGLTNNSGEVINVVSRVNHAATTTVPAGFVDQYTNQ